MHRRPLLRLLGEYSDRYPGERGVIDRVRALVESHADCFDRACRPGHITGSAWVLSADRKQSLLLHHKKLDRWVQPGGHADGDPNALAVALREATEESGLTDLVPLGSGSTILPLDIDIHTIPARFDASGAQVEGAHEHHDIRFLLASTEGAPIIVSDESHDVRWFSPEAVAGLTREESVLRLQRKAAPWMRLG